MKKNSYQQCLDKIYRLGRFGIKLELDTIKNILNQLDNPERKYNLVHVAGTNGKGSTATYIASILRKAGFKTGVYTSPHLIRFNERMTINGRQISNDDVVKAYEAVHKVDTGQRKATFFEIVTAMGFYYFAKKNVEWAIIETGMGGRFDATNIINPKVSVITNLSIEHTDYLGNTIKALAREKAGIIKAYTPVVTAVSQPSGLKVIQETAKLNLSDLHIYRKDFSIRKNPKKSSYNYKGLNQNFNHLIKPLPGTHQKENLSLALAACELILGNLDTPLVKKGLSITRWPGRLEHVLDKPLVIIDGAHNLKAARVLGKYLSSTLKDKKLTLVIGILDDKPHEKMLESLVPYAKNIIITKAKIDRSLDSSILKKAVQKITNGSVIIIEDVKDAVSHAIDISDDDDAVCIAGSLYVAGEAREKLTINN